MPHGYGLDLAYIHDTGFGSFARSAAPYLLQLFHETGIDGGLVVDLGCGSGIWACELDAAGYGVSGIDLSPAMIAIARQRAPSGQFQTCSCLSANLPDCVAITAIGEILSYLFDPANNTRSLVGLFRRVHKALQPGGLFIFDVAAPGRAGGRGAQKTHREGEDWAVLVTAEEDPRRKLLTRRITSFRRVGEHYRRDDEVHRLRLFERAELIDQLRGIGFRVKTLKGYGQLHFARGHIGFLARKR